MSDLLTKIRCADFEEILTKKGYSFFIKGAFNLNIIGVRKSGDTITNKFDDYIVVIYKGGGVGAKFIKRIYKATTEPGAYYMNNLLSPKGAAILVPGQYKGCWAIGLHKNKYEALCQQKPVKVYRDKNKDKAYDKKPETIEVGNFGINIHRSNPNVISNLIDKYSAGCQVFANPNDFKEFMELCTKQRLIYGNSFTYTLLNEEDLG